MAEPSTSRIAEENEEDPLEMAEENETDPLQLNAEEEKEDDPAEMRTEEEKDDPPQLSEDTMKALMEFYEEQKERELKQQEIAEGKIPDLFDEDWNKSQFWYTEETAEAIAKECLRLLGDDGELVCISCPSIYRSVRKFNENAPARLLEFDTRFAVFKEDFVLYDFRIPLDVPKGFREKFSVVIADPPYLSEDCLTSVAITMKYVGKPDAKMILCTGAIMEETVETLLKFKRCSFPIKHQKRLSNPFACYSNYDLDATCKPL